MICMNKPSTAEEPRSSEHREKCEDKVEQRYGVRYQVLLIFHVEAVLEVPSRCYRWPENNQEGRDAAGEASDVCEVGQEGQEREGQ